MIKWEYKIINAELDDKQYFSALGQKGWELVSILYPGGAYANFYFKRPIKE